MKVGISEGAHRAPSSLSNGANSSSASSTRLDSGTNSPRSSQSSINELPLHEEKNNGAPAVDLNLNMTASQMRQLIAQRKKKDAKKANLDLREKYEIIQQM